MKFFLPMFLSALLLSCNNKPNSNDKNNINQSLGADTLNTNRNPKNLTYKEKLNAHLNTIKTKNDTTFLGFVLGSSKKSVKEHLDYLVRNGTTKKSDKIVINMIGGNIIISGHPYTLSISENSDFKTLFHFNYSNGKLYEIHLNIYKGYHVEQARRLFTEKYGSEIRSGLWIKNNTEIVISGDSQAGIGDIIYRDLSRRIELDNDEENIKKKLEAEKIEAIKKTKDVI